MLPQEWQTVTERDMVTSQFTWTIYILMGTNHICGTAEARVVKFCLHVGYVKSQHKDDKSPLKGRG